MKLFFLGRELQKRYEKCEFKSEVRFSNDVDGFLSGIKSTEDFNKFVLFIHARSKEALSLILTGLENKAPSIPEFVPLIIFTSQELDFIGIEEYIGKVDGFIHDFPDPRIVENLALFYRERKSNEIEKEKRRMIKCALYMTIAENLAKSVKDERLAGGVYLGIDNYGYIRAATDEILNVLGYSRDEIIGRHFSEIVSRDELEKVKRIFTERRTGKRGSKEVKIRFKTKEGKTTEVIVDATGLHIPSIDVRPEKDPYRVHIGTLCYSNIRNVFEKTGELDKAKIIYEAFRSTSAPILIYDPDRKYLYPNYGFLNYTGYSLEEIYDKDLSYFEMGDEKADRVSIFDTYLDQLKENNHVVFRAEIRSKTGEKKCCEVTADLVEIDSRQLIYLAFDDLSGMIKFVDDLQAVISLSWEVSRAYTIERIVEKTISIVSSIIKSPLLFIYLESELEKDSHNILVSSNNMTEWMDYYDEGIPEILREGVREAIEKSHPQYIPLEDGNILLGDLLKKEMKSGTLVIFPFGTDGERLGATGLISPEHGRFTVHELRVLELTSSIIGTALKKFYLEKEKEQYLSHLEDLVKERTKELENYVYVVSHDLKSPLHAARGFVDMVKSRFAGFIKTEDDEYILRRAFENIDQAISMIDGLLVLSRIGTQELKIEEVNLKKVVEDYFIQRKALGNGEVEIDYKIEGELPKIMADKAQIVQLFNNVLDNSIKYRKGNRVKISVKGVKKSDRVIVSIEDDGIGIEEDEINRVFDVFYRGMGSSEAVEGTGLGLTIVKKILDRQGGRVAVESEPGKGTRVTMEIPLKWKQD